MHTPDKQRRSDQVGYPAYGAEYCVYIHVDPERKRLLYVGITSTPGDRPTQFSDRGRAHRKRLHELLDAGYSRDQIVHIVAENLSCIRAQEIEDALVTRLEPPFNVTGRSLWTRGVLKQSPISQPSIER